MIGDLLDLAGGDQRGNGDEASVAGRKVRAQPQVVEEIVRGVLDETGRDVAELVSDVGRAGGFSFRSPGDGDEASLSVIELAFVGWAGNASFQVPLSFSPSS
jgi:hypothetical protein